MEAMPVNYIPGDPVLIANIVWELKSQGIFDNFRKECIADVDTKPAYQNLRQRVEGSVSSFLKRQKWSPDLNKNQLREQLRKNIHESGYLEAGVERIVDQVVNPKINSVFLPTVTDLVYKYLGLTKPDPKINKEKDEELKTKTEELLPNELEAVSPESRADEINDDSNLSLESMKIDEDESPPFEPLEEEISVDSHMSGISALRSHDSNASPKALQIDDSQMSKHSSEENVMEVDEKVEVDHIETLQDTNSKGFEGDSNSNSFKIEHILQKDSSNDSATSEKTDVKLEEKEEKDEKIECKDDTENKSESKETHERRDSNRDKDRRKSDSRSHSDSKSKSDRKHDHSKDKYRDKESKDKNRDRDRSKSDKDKSKSSSHRHSSDRKKDDRRDRDRDSSSKRDKDKDSSSKDRDRSSKSRDDKSRSRSDSHRDRKSTSSRSEKDKDKDKRDKYKDKKDDHYSTKNKSERRSNDRDSNDGSGVKGSSLISYDSSTSQRSQKESSNSNDSGTSGSSKKPEHKYKSSSHSKHKSHDSKSHSKSERESSKGRKCNEKTAKEIEEKNISMSFSAATWEKVEAELTISVNCDYSQDPDSNSSIAEITGKEFFSQNEIEDAELCANETSIYIANLEKEIEKAKSMLGRQKRRNCMPPLLNVKKNKNNNVVEKQALINQSAFNLPLSPAESDSDKSTDKKPEPESQPTIPEPKRKSGLASQRYSSDDLYKPRPIISRTTSRRRGNLDKET